MSGISKRFWALLLAASMVFSMMAMSVSAAEPTDSGLQLDEVQPVAPTDPEIDPTVPEIEGTMPQVTMPAETVPEGTTPEDTVPEQSESLEQKTIESIEVPDLTLYPETCGEWVKYKDPATSEISYFYRYNWHYEAKLQINFTDGESRTLREFPMGTFEAYGKKWTLSVEVGQQRYTDEWQPGNTYTSGVVTLMNETDNISYTDNVSVTIKESAPLVSLSVEPETI